MFDKEVNKNMILSLFYINRESKDFADYLRPFLQLCLLNGKELHQFKSSIARFNVTYASTYLTVYLQQLDEDSEVFTDLKKVRMIQQLCYSMYNYLEEDVLVRVVGLIICAYMRFDSNPDEFISDEDMSALVDVLPLVNRSVYLHDDNNVIMMSRDSSDVHFRSMLTREHEKRNISMIRSCMHNGVLNMDAIKALDFGHLQSINHPALRMQANGEVNYTMPNGGVVACQQVQLNTGVVNGGTYATLFAVATIFYCDAASLLLFLLPRWLYKSDLYESQDWLVVLEVDLLVDDENRFFIRPNAALALNQHKVVGCLSPSHTDTEKAVQLQNFPFLAVMPQTSMMFVIKDDLTNAFSVFLLQHNREVGCFSNAVFKAGKYKHNSRLVVNIQNNFLLPELTPAESKVFALMIENSAGSLVGFMNEAGPRIPHNLDVFTQRNFTKMDIAETWGSVFKLAKGAVSSEEYGQGYPDLYTNLCREFKPTKTLSLEDIVVLLAQIARKVTTVLPTITQRLRECVRLRILLCKRIKWTLVGPFNCFTFLTENANNLLPLLQCNTYITT
ncbi:MAG: hypothetical protein WCK80_04185, partial [bacterium]